MAGNNQGRVPDWVPFIGTEDKWNYWTGAGDESGNTALGDVGSAVDEIKEEYVDPAITSLTNAKDATFDFLGDAKDKVTDFAGKHSGYDQNQMNWMRKNIDPSDPEQTKKLQKMLGLKEDGLFGPKTQDAWRRAVELDQSGGNQSALGVMPSANEGRDPVRYDYNDQLLEQNIANKPTKLGGLLQRAAYDRYQRIKAKNPERASKLLFKGGYDEGASSLTPSEFDDFGYGGD